MLHPKELEEKLVTFKLIPENYHMNSNFLVYVLFVGPRARTGGFSLL